MEKRGRARGRGCKKVESRIKINLYESTIIRWNDIRNRISMTHDNFALYLLDLYNEKTKEGKDDHDIVPRLTPVKNTDQATSSTPLRIKSHNTIFSSDSLYVAEKERTVCTPRATRDGTEVLPSLRTLFSVENETFFLGEFSQANRSIHNESMPFDDLASVTVQDSREFSSYISESTIIDDGGDETYTPSDEEDEESDSELFSDSSYDGDIYLGPPPEDITHIFSDVDNDSDDDEMVEERSFALDNDHPIICFKSKVRQLLNIVPPSNCSKCNVDLIVCNETIIGSCLRLKWKCMYGHLCHEWSSQPLLRNSVNLGDLQLSSAIFLSGNNFEKIELLCSIFNLPMVSKSAHYRFQSSVIIPIVNKAWESVVRHNRVRSSQNERILLGDGRMDSPGFCAKYCTYVAMDYDTNDIISLEVIDKREVSLKSPLMEKEGFVRTLDSLESDGINIKEVVTDAHTQIAKYMRESHPGKDHTFEIWHAAKNLGKRLSKVCDRKENKDARYWIKDIVKHFWYCVETSESHNEFVAKWKGILHHVTGKHEWFLGEGYSNCCEHDDTATTDDKPILIPNSPPHQAIKKVIWDIKFIKSIVHLLKFRSTAVIENFNMLVLKYASKRIAYRYDAYKGRNQLAALDYQFHKNRPNLIKKTGDVVHKRKFNKNSNRWTIYPAKVKKEYTYIPEIMNEIVKSFDKNESFISPLESNPRHPLLISPTIAPIPAPDTATLVSEQKSRFCKQ